jgi:hypothetical protein
MVIKNKGKIGPDAVEFKRNSKTSQIIEPKKRGSFWNNIIDETLFFWGFLQENYFILRPWIYSEKNFSFFI